MPSRQPFRSRYRRKVFEFSVEPLPNDGKHIRLVKLLPGNADLDSVVEIELGVYNLDEELPPYCALSYTWRAADSFGHGDKYNPVLCAGRVYHVTSNLWYALGHLRYEDRPRYLWVDQICIRQGDSTEKSHQIPLMQKIYKKAPGGVIAWLGQEASSDILRYLRSIAGKPLWDEAKFDIDQDDDFGDSQPHNPKHYVNYPAGIKAMVQFLARPWFNRIWIVQEATAQKDRLSFQFGEFSIAFSVLLSVIEATNRLLVAAKPSVHNEPTSGRTTYFAFLRACPILDAVGEPGVQTLQELVQKFCAWDSTDPRDKIYALLGLASDSALYPAPDYTTDHCSLYRQVTEIWLKSGLTSALPTLSFAVLHARVPNQPSWFVDWETFGTKRPVSPLRYNYKFSSGGAIDSSSTIYDFDGKRLCLGGRIIDRVAKVGDVLEAPDSVRSWLKSALNLLEIYRSRVDRTEIDARADLALLLVLDGQSSLYETDGHEIRTGEIKLDPKFIKAGWIDPDFAFTVYRNSNTGKTPGLEYLEEGVDQGSARFDNPSAWPKLDNLWLNLGHEDDSSDHRERDIQAVGHEEQGFVRHWDSSAGDDIGAAYGEDTASDESTSAQESDKSTSAQESDEDKSPPLVSDASKAFRDALWAINAGQHVIITEGGMIGIANQRTKPGDNIIVLQGARMPFVAEAALDGAGYSVVSEAFIRGIMHGQIIEERPDWEKIVIV